MSNLYLPRRRASAEKGQQLCLCGTLHYMCELFTEAQIFLGKLTQKIADNPAMMNAGRQADVQDAFYIRRNDCDRRFRYYTYISVRSQMHRQRQC